MEEHGQPTPGVLNGIQGRRCFTGPEEQQPLEDLQRSHDVSGCPDTNSRQPSIPPHPPPHTLHVPTFEVLTFSPNSTVIKLPRVSRLWCDPLQRDGICPRKSCPRNCHVFPLLHTIFMGMRQVQTCIADVHFSGVQWPAILAAQQTAHS